MAPSERSSPEISRYLTSSSEQKESPPGVEEGLEAEHFISGEEYWVHHRTSEERPDMEKLHDDGDDESHNSNGDHDHRLPHLSRRNPRNKSTNPNNNSTFPELRYVRGEILSPTSLASEQQQQHQYSPSASGDSGYMSPKSTSQYQVHPGQSDNNGGSANGNYHSNNGAHPPRPYPNGGAHPIPPHPNYPYHHYPQPAGYPYYHDPHGQYVISNTTSNGLDVRGEEVGIVIVVLLLWVGAIILFFNRWGKIRMLEPYQPKFCENHRPSCPMAEVTAGNHPVCSERAFSKFNLSTEMLASPHFVKCNYHGIPASDPIPGYSGLSTTMMPGGGLTIPGAGFPTGGSTGMLSNHRNSFMMSHHHQHHRPRQNSVFVTSPSSQVSFYGSDTTLKNMSRKTKSAVDLPTLVLSGEFVDNASRNSKSSITQL